MFGGIYYIVPRVAGIEWPSPKLLKAHFWFAVAGLVLAVVPLAIGGVVQGFKLQDPAVPFDQVVKATMPFLRASTVGDLSLAVGNVLFLVNVAGLVCRYGRVQATAACSAMTGGLAPAEVKP
jgi:cytochrome c oxidase cbb3-type subunit 1